MLDGVHAETLLALNLYRWLDAALPTPGSTLIQPQKQSRTNSKRVFLENEEAVLTGSRDATFPMNDFAVVAAP